MKTIKTKKLTVIYKLNPMNLKKIVDAEKIHPKKVDRRQETRQE